jgi:hypothetical protein
MRLNFSRPNFEKKLNIKFNGNPIGRSRVVSNGRTDTIKLTVTFRSLANAPKKHSFKKAPNFSFWLRNLSVMKNTAER